MAFEPHIFQSLRDHLGVEVAEVLNELHEKVHGDKKPTTDENVEIDTSKTPEVST